MRGVLRLWLPRFVDALHGVLAEQGTALKLVLCPRLTLTGRAGPGLCPLSFLLIEQGMGTVWTSLSHHLCHPQAYIAGHIVLFFAWLV